MMGVYKITNTINGKIYVGVSFDIERRWEEHIRCSLRDNLSNNSKFYNAINFYGVQNFTFEVIEECQKDQLKDREIYWINFYNSFIDGYNSTTGGDISGFNVQGENHPNSKLTQKDVEDIRQRYSNLERRMEVYSLYKHKINQTGFNKVWKGENWKNVRMDVYTKNNKYYHKNNSAMVGSNNGRAKINEEEIYKIRLRKKNGEQKRQVYQDYSNMFSLQYFTNIWCGYNWKNVIVD